jgi:hypothetical protein
VSVCGSRGTDAAAASKRDLLQDPTGKSRQRVQPFHLRTEIAADCVALIGWSGQERFEFPCEVIRIAVSEEQRIGMLAERFAKVFVCD